MFLGIVFNGSMEYKVYVCAASLVGKGRSKETKWSYEKVEIAACVVERVREVCSQYEAKVMFAVGGNKLWSHRLCFWLFGGEVWMSPKKMLPRGEGVARCRSGIRHRHRHSQFWGWNKVVPVCGVLNLSNSYSTGIPWSKRNRRKESINLIGSLILSMLLLLFKSRQMGRLYRTKSSCKKAVFGSFPNFCCPERNSAE